MDRNIYGSPYLLYYPQINMKDTRNSQNPYVRIWKFRNRPQILVNFVNSLNSSGKYNEILICSNDASTEIQLINKRF